MRKQLHSCRRDGKEEVWAGKGGQKPEARYWLKLVQQIHRLVTIGVYQNDCE